MFTGQVVGGGQALLHSRQMSRVKIERLYISAQLAARLLKLNQRSVEQFTDRDQAGIKPNQSIQLPQAVIQPVGKGVFVAFGQAVEQLLAGIQ